MQNRVTARARRKGQKENRPDAVMENGPQAPLLADAGRVPRGREPEDAKGHVLEAARNGGASRRWIHSVKPPTIPIPFHKLLKIVAMVEREDAQTKKLLDYLAEENFEVEISDSFKRDVVEDAEVGAYVVMLDGEHVEPARALAKAVRDIGFRTPLWAVADSHQIPGLQL
jgi:hypothetical protein